MKDSNLSKIIYLINGIIAWIIYLFIPTKRKKGKFWLISGHLGQVYDDNSKVFFEYIIKEKEKQEIFWVLNKNSIAETQITEKSKILYRGSIKAYLYCYRSSTIIVSHSFADVMPIFYKFKIYFNIKAVYLGHGVDGFKKAKFRIENYYSYFDLITSVGEFEREIKCKSLGVKKDIVKIVGMPRYDRLIRGSKYNRDIMIMFTWRDYLEDNAESSEYFGKIKELLTDEQFLKILEDNNVSVNVMLHSFVHKYYNFIKQLESKNIKVLGKNENVQKQLIENSLLITDYSSVSWDFYYMNKPVVFYQFDLDEYLSDRGSYLDLRKDLFGEVAYDKDKLISIIYKYIKDGFKEKNFNYRSVTDYFDYNDNKNCKRLYDEITKLSI